MVKDVDEFPKDVEVFAFGFLWHLSFHHDKKVTFESIRHNADAKREMEVELWYNSSGEEWKKIFLCRGRNDGRILNSDGKWSSKNFCVNFVEFETNNVHFMLKLIKEFDVTIEKIV